MITAGELCNRAGVVCDARETLEKAAMRMRDGRVGCLIVVELRGGAAFPVGVLTERDIVIGAVATRGGDPRARLVGDVMSSPVVTAREQESLVAALSRMRASGVRRLVVVDDRGAYAGIMTVDELVAFFSDEMRTVGALLARDAHRERCDDGAAPAPA